MTATPFRALWDTLAPVGRADGGGYLRYAWSAAELSCRRWFTERAAERDMPVEQDGNGNLWATWVAGDGPAVVTGSHFDSVPYGGGYDGTLGIAAAFLAVDELRDRGVRPARPLRVVAFAEEEGARFGVACLGSRLLTGGIDPARALALTDPDGVTLAEAMTGAGADPAGVGPDPRRLAGMGSFVELHVEQGRALADVPAPVGVGTGIWPHGRWRLDITGTGNHAGTTLMADRRDPMLTFAYTVLAANKEARRLGVHATVGRAEIRPGATNAVPAAVRAWLDARAATPEALQGLVDAVAGRAADRAARDRTSVALTAESATGAVMFDGELTALCQRVLDAPALPTAAGHDAGVLAAHVPTTMLFVRNPTGVSHAPDEAATDDDCAAGVAALARVLEVLLCR